MRKYLPIFIIFLGIIANLLVLFPLYIHSWQTVIGLLIGVLGVNLAISNYKKSHNITWEKNCLILGGTINIAPVLYFIFLIFAIS